MDKNYKKVMENDLKKYYIHTVSINNSVVFTVQFFISVIKNIHHFYDIKTFILYF